MSQRPSTRLVLGAVLAITSLVIGERSLASERLECERARGTCVLERGSPLVVEPSRTISVADVASVEFNERRGRGSARGETLLMSPRGDELRVAEDGLADARLHHARLKAFFAGEGERAEVVVNGAPAVAFGCAVVALFGLYQVVTAALALRRGRGGDARGVDPPTPRRTRPPWLRKLALLAVLFAALAIGLLTYVKYTQGTLELTCDQRCEFAGGECRPGQTREWSETPGTYAVRVWDPAAPDGWRTLEVTLVAGETTRLRCALP